MKAILMLLLSVSAFADEHGTLPKDYKDAQDIIKKKQVDGHKGAYWLMWPNWPTTLKQKDSAGRSAVATKSVPDKPGSEAENIGPEIPAAALAMLKIPPPPPRDFAHEPGVQFAEGVSQEFIAWATMMPKREAKKS